MPKKGGPKLPNGMAYLENLTLPKSLFKNMKNVICVDHGASLIKLMFVSHKDWNTDENNYLFTCASFKRQNMKECLKWFKENVYLEGMNKMIMTGTGGTAIKKAFMDVFHLEFDFVSEMPAQCRGFIALLETLGKDQVFYEREKPTLENIESTDILKELHASNGAVEGNANWPVLFIYAGASTVIMKLNQDATYEIIGTSMNSGKSLMGLCSLMLNTGEYDEIAPLAVKGERKGVDTCVWELFPGKDAEGSTYAHYPSEYPIFSFGKAGDYNKSLYKYKRTDLATCGTFYVAANLAHELIPLCKLTKIYKVIIGGNMFKAQCMRKFLVDNLGMLKMENVIQVDVVNTGHTGALGAMIIAANSS